MFAYVLAKSDGDHGDTTAAVMQPHDDATDDDDDDEPPDLADDGSDSDSDSDDEDIEDDDDVDGEVESPSVLRPDPDSDPDDEEGDGWTEVEPSRRTKHHSATAGAATVSEAAQSQDNNEATLKAFHVSARQGLKQYGSDAHRAIIKELDQLYRVKKAIAPVRREDLPVSDRKGIIRSSLFLNPKHNAMGTFEKIKARLVGNGAQQDKNLYPDRSSPTAALESIMAVLTVVAKEQRHAACLDIGSAYLEAEWQGDPTHIVLEPMITTIMAHKFPELKSYVQKDGTMLLRVQKALYGTLIAGKLWFDKLTAALKKLGFTANPIDPCVMNKTYKGKQLTLCLFVDDILATCADKSGLTWIINQLKGLFDEVKGSISDDFSYLGMHVNIDREHSRVHLSMEGYEQELRKYANVTGVRKTPATAQLFQVGSSPVLTSSPRAHFHTVVAKLLYLSLRTRPDIALAVSFLTTRVTCANTDDMKKLDRVLQYLNGAQAKRLTLSCKGPLRVGGLIDVAFGAHDDGKGHTGTAHQLGDEATVMAKSSKQTMVGKESTEAELIGLTDKVDGVLKLDEFMRAQGHDMELPVIYQDNLSTISLVTRGGGKYRSKHLRVRQCRIKEKIDNGELVIEHRGTANMYADVLTKPLQGNLFFFMIKNLLNEESQSVNR